jgi:hypothetical protein
MNKNMDIDSNERKLFTLQNIGVWKESLGTNGENGWWYNDSIMVNKQIWSYDERYCKDDEFVPQVWECPNTDEFDEDRIIENFCGMGVLWENYGLETDECEVVFLTQEERDELSLNPIGEMGIHKRRYEKTLFKPSVVNKMELTEDHLNKMRKSKKNKTVSSKVVV